MLRAEELTRRTHERFSDSTQRDAFGFGLQSCLETFYRLVHRFFAQAESLMVDRHDVPGIRQGGQINGLLRIAVIPDPGVIRADWHDRQFERPTRTQVGKQWRVSRVTAEKKRFAFTL